MTLENGTLLHKRYRITEILGQGGMGSVYRALDENLGVDVAVKENLFTTDEYTRQFRLEAVLLANLRHPNLPRVTDHFVIGEQGQYLVMDYIEGEDLRQRMERLSTLPDDEVILIGIAMCDALAYLHNRKPPILHRDIKPGNVKITPEGQVFLVDFGLAKVIQGSQMTTTGARAMTPGYSPPEQYGTARTDLRTDIYSLGATLYAASAGVIPEDGLTRAMDNIQLTALRKRNPKVSHRLATAIEKAMAVNTDDRFQTAEKFRVALLSSRAKTQRINGEIIITPPPPSVEVYAREKSDDLKSKKPALVKQTLPKKVSSAPSEPPSTPRKKQRRSCCLVLILTVVLIASGITGISYQYPDISKRVTNWLTMIVQLPTLYPVKLPTSTLTVSLLTTETIPPLSQTETRIPTSTNTATATIIPTTTLTPTLTITPTPSSTPVGGGYGQIAFASNRTGIPQIYIVNVDGRNLHQLTNIAEGACQPDWSPDGWRLVFISPCRGNENIYVDANLYIINADGTDLTPLLTTPNGGFEPAWSPDGGLIAFTSARNGYLQIYILNLVDNSVKRLGNKEGNTEARQPAWSPSGAQIVYTVNRYEAYQIWTMTEFGQAQEQLVRSGTDFWDFLPTWSSDGMYILFSQRRANGPLKRTWLMSIRYEDRSMQGTEVKIGPLPVLDAMYSPDGFWIIYEGIEGENYDIFVSTVTGANRTRVTTDPGVDFDPAWRPIRVP